MSTFPTLFHKQFHDQHEQLQRIAAQLDGTRKAIKALTRVIEDLARGRGVAAPAAAAAAAAPVARKRAVRKAGAVAAAPSPPPPPAPPTTP